MQILKPLLSLNILLLTSTIHAQKTTSSAPPSQPSSVVSETFTSYNGSQAFTTTPTPTLTRHFSPTLPASLASHLKTWAYGPSLASALSSVAASFSAKPAWTELAEDVAVVAKTYPSDLQSLIVQGDNWEVIINQPWYTAVQTQYRELLQAEIDAQQKLVDDAIAKGDWVSGGTAGRDRTLFTWMGVGLAALLVVMLIL